MLLAHLIQAGYYGHPSGFFYGMSAGTMGSWILIIVIGIVGWIVQARLQSVFAKYARVPFPHRHNECCHNTMRPPPHRQRDSPMLRCWGFLS